MSNKTKTTGILTLGLRKTLGRRKIASNVYLDEFDPKRGSISSKIKELPEDFQIIIGSPHCWNLLADYDIHNKLSQLEGILSKLDSWHPVPIHRITANKKGAKRIFTIEKVTVLEWIPDEMNYFQENFADEETALEPKDRRERLENIRKEYYLKKIKKESRLKPNEWKVVLQYYKRIEKINPFHLPLDENKQYSWQEVKKNLGDVNVKKPRIETMNNDPQKSNKIRIQIASDEKKITEIVKDIDRKISKYGWKYILRPASIVKADPSKDIKDDDIPIEKREGLLKFAELEKEFRNKIKELNMTAQIVPYFY